MRGMLSTVWLAAVVAVAAIPGVAEADTDDERLGIASLPDVAELAEQQRHHVVSVQTEMAGPAGDLPPLFDGLDDEPAQGEGSGFIIDEDGMAVTNWHVVARAQAIEVITAEGTTYEAQLVGADPSTDIALIDIDAPEPLQPAELGSVDELEVGEWVVAIGNPYGLDQSVTLGVLSATGREIGMGPYDDFLQTDASINPGNSGGPLFNLDGEVVGVNTAIIPFGGNIGFAVPIDTVTQIEPELRERGYVVRGFIGAGVQDMSRALAETFDLEPDDGVLVRSVEDGGPADEAGLEEGDVITHVDGQRTRESSQLLSAVAWVDPDETTSIELLRNGQQMELTIDVEQRPDPDREEVLQTLDPDPIEPGRLGVVLRPVSPDMAQRRDLPDTAGVYVDRIEAGSPASGVLRTGDVLLSIGDTQVTSPQEVPDVLREQPREEPIRIQLDRDGEPHFVAVELAAAED